MGFHIRLAAKYVVPMHVVRTLKGRCVKAVFSVGEIRTEPLGPVVSEADHPTE